MMNKIIVSGIFIACSATAFSQEDSTKEKEKPQETFSIHGSADAYYKYDFNKQASNGLTSFTQTHNKFELGMASVTMQYETSKTRVVLDLGFGKRAQDFSYPDDGILQAVKQAYISYMPTNNFTITAGSFGTHIGYELLDAYLNKNYSMSYMFSTGPFSNTGIKVEYSAGKNSFMLGVTNPTDYKYVPDDVINKKFIIAQYHYNGGDNFNFYLNYTGGEWVDTSKVNQFDVVISSQLNSQFSLGVNGTVGFKKLWLDESYTNAKKWWGGAVYLNGDFTKHLSATFREECFNDKNALTGIPTNGGNVWSSTLSFNIKPDEHLTIIPELRMDAASKEMFLKSNGTATKTDASFILAAVYHF